MEMLSKRNSDILSLFDTCPSQDIRQMLHSCNVMLSLNLALCAYRLLLSKFSTNTLSGLCSGVKRGVHRECFLLDFQPSVLHVGWNRKHLTHTTDEEVLNVVSWCLESRGHRHTEILCPASQGSAFTRKGTKSHCHDLRYRSKACSCFTQRPLSKRAAPGLRIHKMMPFEHIPSVPAQSIQQSAK